MITSWNKGAEKLLGWRADDAIGQSIHLIVPPELRDRSAQILERLRNGERVEQLDVERVRKDGSRVHTLGHDLAGPRSPWPHHRRVEDGRATSRRARRGKHSLVRSEEAQRLLVGIHDATRGLADPAIVMREIVTRVGMHFNVTRCAYGEVDADQTALLVARGYTQGRADRGRPLPARHLRAAAGRRAARPDAPS